MPRLKVLKGIAHNIGHSFTSTMNYARDDYTMGHLLRFARETGKDTLIVDFVTGESKPIDLLRDPISDVPSWYTKRFWEMVASSGSDRALVLSATLTLKFDLARTWTGFTIIEPASPYVCDVSITDIRGKDYRAHFEGWWHCERAPSVAHARRWWNPRTWFLRG